MDLSVLWIGLLIAFIAWKLWSSRRSPAQLAEIQAALDQGAHLLDVRGPVEFSHGHLDHARNIPLGQEGSVIDELTKSGKPVVVYCASGTRSAMAARRLKAGGVQVVYDLGPMNNGATLRTGGKTSA